MMELCCSQYWSDLSNAKMSLKVTFHSLHPNAPNVKFVSCISIASQILCENKNNFVDIKFVILAICLN